jgi:hypothetical protein
MAAMGSSFGNENLAIISCEKTSFGYMAYSSLAEVNWH